MTEYKTGQPAYLEYLRADGNTNKGVWLITSQDRWNIEIRDEEYFPIIPKKDIKIYEPDREKWPAWVGKVNAG